MNKHTSETSFCLINKNRRTIEAGEQVFYCYGNRTNKFLLINYGFCFPGNAYDSLEFPVRLDVEIEGEQDIHKLVDLDWKC